MHAHAHKLNFMNIHGCISYASVQRTAGKHLARKLMKQHPPLLATYYISLFFALSPSLPALSINPAHSATPSVSSPLSPSHSLSFPSSLFSSPSPQSWGYWPTWHALMIIPIMVRHPLPAWPRCLLIILLWLVLPEAWPTNHSSHDTFSTFREIVHFWCQFSFLSVC